MSKHTKSLETSSIPSWEMPHLGIFPWNPIRWVQIYKYYFSQKIYLINAEIHQITLNKWYSKFGNAPSWNISKKSYKMCPNMLKPKYIYMSVSTKGLICHSNLT